MNSPIKWMALALLAVLACTRAHSADDSRAASPKAKSEFIRVSKDGKSFLYSSTGRKFIPWGFNYDHDRSGRLLESYWKTEWKTVVADFQEMKALGANTVRIHLQLSRFMTSPDQPNQESLAQLGRLLALAETNGLYLDITGLGCYDKKDVPQWYNDLDEQPRWNVQARYWEAVTKVCN